MHLWAIGESANELALDASPIAATLIEFAQQQGNWEGKSSELLEELNKRASDETKKQRGWPKRSNTLSGAIKRIAPNLRATGIEYSTGRTKSQRYLVLEFRGQASSSASPSSSSQESSVATGPGDDSASDNAEDDLGITVRRQSEEVIGL